MSKKYKNWLLIWYSAPMNGGLREIVHSDVFESRAGSDVNNIMEENGLAYEDSIFEIWQFDTLYEALEADAKEWKLRTLDTKKSEEKRLRKIMYE